MVSTDWRCLSFSYFLRIAAIFGPSFCIFFADSSDFCVG